MLGDGVAGDEVTFLNVAVNANSGVGLVQFSDGKTWTRAQVIEMTIPGSDPGPTLTIKTVPAVGHDQTVADGTVAPGLAGDVLTLTTPTGGQGTLSLANGTLTYVAASISGPDTVGYVVTDQLGNSVSSTFTTTVDGGPTLTAGQLVAAQVGSSSLSTFVAGLVTPGLATDTVTVTGSSAQSGTVSTSAGVTTYLVPASGSGVITYTVTDQVGETATGTVAVTVDPG